MFDFGLAKRITNADKAEDDLYNLTGNTGSLRYMVSVANEMICMSNKPETVFKTN